MAAVLQNRKGSMNQFFDSSTVEEVPVVNAKRFSWRFYFIANKVIL